MESLSRSEASVTGADTKEYVEALRERYLGASKKERGRTPNELEVVVGYHRKSAVRLLGHRKPVHGPTSGCGNVYKGEVVDVLRIIREEADHTCTTTLHPFPPIQEE